MKNSASPPVVTRADLAASWAASGLMSRNAATFAIGRLIDVIAGHLRAGATVHLKGLGRFTVADAPERAGRNPRTGEPCTIPARRRVKFKPSQTLLEGRGEGEAP